MKKGTKQLKPFSRNPQTSFCNYTPTGVSYRMNELALFLEHGSQIHYRGLAKEGVAEIEEFYLPCTAFAFVYADRAYCPSSLPIPDCLTPLWYSNVTVSAIRLRQRSATSLSADTGRRMYVQQPRDLTICRLQMAQRKAARDYPQGSWCAQSPSFVFVPAGTRTHDHRPK